MLRQYPRSYLTGLFFSVSLIAMIIAGCTPSPNQSGTTSSKGGTPQTAEEAAEQFKDSQCADLMSSLLGQFANPQVVLNFDGAQALSLLNQWSRNCRPDVGSLSSDDVRRLDELVGPSLVKLMQDDIYSARDVEHLKTAVWMGIIKQHAASEETDDLDRVTALFNYVVRNVSLIPEHPEGTPFSINGVLFSGQGTVEDRAWLFAELLKQMRLDTVLITPEQSADAEVVPAPRLVGVFLRGEFWLFDPELGIAVPAKADKIVPGQKYEIATLSSLLENPELLDRLSISGHPYPLNKETLPKAEYWFYGHSSWWAPRLLELAEQFVGPTQSEIYDGLTDLSGRRGLLSRMEEVSGKFPEGTKLKFWNYAETQLAGRENPNSLQQQVITRLVDLYQYPYVQDLSQTESQGSYDDPTNARAKPRTPQGPLPPKPSGDYFRGRGMQILGDRVDGVRTYVNNQRNSRVYLEIDNPQALSNPDFIRFRDAHGRVMSDGIYWIGICKLEQTAPDSLRIAQDKFSQYVRDYPEGIWATSALYQLALLSAKQGEGSKGLEFLVKIPESDPMAPMARWLEQELGGQPAAGAAEEAIKSEEKPAEPMPEEKQPEPEQKPEEAKPEEAKPEEAKPEEAKPEEQKEEKTESPKSEENKETAPESGEAKPEEKPEESPEKSAEPPKEESTEKTSEEKEEKSAANESPADQSGGSQTTEEKP